MVKIQDGKEVEEYDYSKTSEYFSTKIPKIRCPFCKGKDLAFSFRNYEDHVFTNVICRNTNCEKVSSCVLKTYHILDDRFGEVQKSGLEKFSKQPDSPKEAEKMIDRDNPIIHFAHLLEIKCKNGHIMEIYSSQFPTDENNRFVTINTYRCECSEVILKYDHDYIRYENVSQKAKKQSKKTKKSKKSKKSSIPRKGGLRKI